jgi:cell wall-associated NlpC family hydrolase
VKLGTLTSIEQYHGPRIQLGLARAGERLAEPQAKRDAAALTAGQLAISPLAAEQDQRARETASQQVAAAGAIEQQMNAKKAVITASTDKVNSAAMSQAMAVYPAAGQYPKISLPAASTVGAQALQYALTRQGDAYVRGAAGRVQFDCSGLVVWSFAQIGISLPHYTGSLWQSGVHISRSDLEPGDLVFFFPDITHAGIFVGNGYMINTPGYGMPVQIDPIDWPDYVGAVRIE